jgi:TPR repeat protein
MKSEQYNMGASNVRGLHFLLRTIGASLVVSTFSLCLNLPANAESEIQILNKNARDGVIWAQFSLGKLLFDGLEVPRNENEAADWLVKVVEQNGDKSFTIPAKFMLGMMAYQECDLYWLSLECGSDRDGAFHWKNYNAAASFFRDAADAGHAEARYQLATMYETGRGVPQDFEQAASLYRAAIQAGMKEARGPLGKLYISIGNAVAAHAWLNLAASDGDPHAKELRDELARKMTPGQIAEAQTLARRLTGR